MNDDFALIIGINHYPSFHSLRGPINDANAMYQWLNDAAGLPEQQIFKVLSEKGEDPVPVQDQIDRKLESIYQAVIDEKKTNRRFFFYFSGHGLGTTISDTALCLSGWSRLWKNNALSSDKYLNMILTSNLFSEVYFFLDCCRNRFNGHRGKEPGITYPILNAENQPKKYVACATEYLDSAYESNVGLTDEMNNYRGHFTRALLDGFKEAVNENGEVTAGKLQDYLDKKTREIADVAGQNQKAIIESNMLKDKVIFQYNVPIDNSRLCMLRFQNPDNKSMILEDSLLNIIQEGLAGQDPWELSLDFGLYSIREVESETGVSFTIRPGEGGQNVQI